jgi:hypothetical protein
VFTGDKLYNPYAGMDSTKWKRANFHLHTRLLFGLTAGAGNLNQVADSFYRFFDYDIYGTSDYMRINYFNNNKKLFIPGYEHGYQYYKTHQLVVNAKSVCWNDYFFHQTLDNKQYILNRLKKDTSSLVAIVHPKYRNAYLGSDLEWLGNYDCLEIANSAHLFIDYFDKALSSGHPVFLIADDDSHDLSDFSDAAHTFNVINSDLDKNAIINALKRGKSYGVNLNLKPYKTNSEKKTAMNNLPVLTGFELLNDTLKVIMNQKADSIKFIGQDGNLKLNSTHTNSSSYHFGKDDTYIRTEIVCKDGSAYYLNPVFRLEGSLMKNEAPPVNLSKTFIYRTVFFGISFLLVFIRIKFGSPSDLKRNSV